MTTTHPEITAARAASNVFGRISRLLVSNSNLDDVLNAILTESMKALNSERAFIAMVDYEHGELAVRYTAGDSWNEVNTALRLKVSKETGRGITSHVAATARPYVTGDVDNDPYYMGFFEDVKSEVAVPIIDADGHTLGVINIESLNSNAYDDSTIEFLLAVSNLVALRIMKERETQRQSALVALGREMGRYARSSSDLYDKVIGTLAKAITFEDCSIFIIAKNTDDLVLRASRGPLGARVQEASYALGEGITGWVAANGQPVRTSDPRKDPRWKGRHEELPPEEVGGLIAVPIQGYERTLGVLRLLRRRSSFAWVANDFTEEDEELVVAIASILGAVIDSIELVRRLVDAERMAAWGEMSARSAHMIGNRVFALKGDINELKHLVDSRELTSAVIKPIIESLDKGIFRLEEILSEFREFVMATKLNSTPTNINDLVREAVSEAIPRGASVKLILNLAENLPEVESDSSKLRRCFSELVENSFNFQQEGGVITVSTELVSGDSPKVRIVVSDSGPGVPDKLKKDIFRPFFSTRAKGMGLGLSIVKGIIDAHRGTIREIGEEGHGATFEITLPAIVDND